MILECSFPLNRAGDERNSNGRRTSTILVLPLIAEQGPVIRMDRALAESVFEVDLGNQHSTIQLSDHSDDLIKADVLDSTVLDRNPIVDAKAGGRR